jgi:phosphatidylserine decarboxylase
MIKIWLQHIVPQHLLSRVLGWLSDRRLPSLSRYAIDFFIKHYNVNMAEAENSDPRSYASFNDFFTRAIKSELRPIAVAGDHLASPADGCVSQLGMIEGNQLLQAKGFHFTVENLLGGDRERANPFLCGHFITIYLSPRDYHRFHMPCAGRLKEVIYIPGDLFSVNQQTASHIPNLFARNERVVCLFETAYGPMAMVLVGAMIVASIVIVGHGVVAPNRPREITSNFYDEQFERGQELGHFKLGSTVIVLFGREVVSWRNDLIAGSVVKMGEMIAEV